MKKLSLILQFLWFSMPLWSQTTGYKMVFSQAKWETVKVSRGLTWHHFHFSEKQLFQSNQNIHYLKIKNKRHRYLF